MAVVLPPLHLHQKEVREAPGRFKVLVAGRRFGKSFFALRECLDRAINHGQDVWFVSPTYNNAYVHWRNAKRMVGKLPTYINEQQKYMEFATPSGKTGSIAFKSGDRPDNLRGAGLDFVVVDEAAFVPSNAWYDVIRPSLTDRRGHALLISTPNGVSNWFYRMYLKGQDENEVEWWSKRYPTVLNVTIPEVEKEVEQAKRDMPELKFRQEYLAEFVTDATGVFRNLETVAVLDPQITPILGHIYIAGVDWGRKNDYTVMSIYDATEQKQVQIVRMPETGYKLQKDKFGAVYDHWNLLKVYAEANSMGGPLIEDLIETGYNVEPIYMTNPTKTSLVERFALLIERNDIQLISPKHDIGELQLGELQAYAMHKTRGGSQITYNAPNGWHDDIVVANILCASHLLPSSTKSSILQFSHNPFYGGVKHAASHDL